MVERLSCILIHTGVPSYGVAYESSHERYTRVFMKASPASPIHFLKIYSSTSGEPGTPQAAGGKALRGTPTVGYDGTQAPYCPSVSAGDGPELCSLSTPLSSSMGCVLSVRPRS